MFEAITQKYAKQFGVPELWIRAVIQTESAGDPTAYRAEPKINDASYGLMQLLFSTAKGLGYVGDPQGLLNPDTNIYYGTKLLAQLRRAYGDNARRVYSAYNSGKPDLYKTSSEVAAHVNRFLLMLDDQAEQFFKSPAVSGAMGPAVALAMAGTVLLLWNAR